MYSDEKHELAFKKISARLGFHRIQPATTGEETWADWLGAYNSQQESWRVTDQGTTADTQKIADCRYKQRKYGCAGSELKKVIVAFY